MSDQMPVPSDDDLELTDDELPTEEQHDDWENRGMCPICSFETGRDVPLPKGGCKACGYNANLNPANMQAFRVVRTFIGNGICLYALFVPEFPSPIGMVWGHEFSVEGNDIFQTHHSYVIPDARRQGVRSKIDEWILHTHDFIMTGDGSDEGGLAYMRKTGYKQDDTTKMWVRTKS